MSDTHSKAERMVGSIDEPKATNGYHETEYADVQSSESSRMTFKKLSALNALLMLSAMSMLPFFLIGGSLCINLVEMFLILAFIAVDLNGPNSYTWLGMVYALAFAAVAPIAGAVSDLVGRRNFALSGCLIVIAGLVVVGTANRMDIGIGGMAIVGAGAGISQTMSVAGIAEIVPAKHRGAYLGTIYMCFFPMAPASAYAQLYSVTSTWRWGGWIPLCLAGIALVLVVFGYHPPPRPNSQGLSAMQVLGRIDYLGGLLWVCGTALFLMGIQWGGYTYPWQSAEVITTVTVGGVMLLAFGGWQRVWKHSTIPATLFVSPMNSFWMLFVIAFGGAVFYAIAAFWLLEVQELFGPSYKEIARNLVTLGFAFLLGIFLVGWGTTISRGQIREIFIISSCMMTAGTGAMLAIDEHTSALSIGLSFLAGLGIGGVYIPSVVVLTLLSPDNLIGTVVGFALSIRFIAGGIGYAIYYNIFSTRLISILPKNVVAAVIPAGLPPASASSFVGALLTKNLTLIAGVKGVTPKVILAAEEAVLASYVEGFALVYYVAIGFGGATIIASFFLGNIRDYMDDRVAVDIH